MKKLSKIEFIARALLKAFLLYIAIAPPWMMFTSKDQNLPALILNCLLVVPVLFPAGIFITFVVAPYSLANLVMVLGGSFLFLTTFLNRDRQSLHIAAVLIAAASLYGAFVLDRGLRVANIH